jgi:hypothetical protein
MVLPSMRPLLFGGVRVVTGLAGVCCPGLAWPGLAWCAPGPGVPGVPLLCWSAQGILILITIVIVIRGGGEIPNVMMIPECMTDSVSLTVMVVRCRVARVLGSPNLEEMRGTTSKGTGGLSPALQSFPVPGRCDEAAALEAWLGAWFCGSVQSWCLCCVPEDGDGTEGAGWWLSVEGGPRYLGGEGKVVRCGKPEEVGCWQRTAESEPVR